MDEAFDLNCESARIGRHWRHRTQHPGCLQCAGGIAARHLRFGQEYRDQWHRKIERIGRRSQLTAKGGIALLEVQQGIRKLDEVVDIAIEGLSETAGFADE